MNKIIQGDCLEIMASLDGVDHVITDPPFNVGKDFDNDNLSDRKWLEFCNRFVLALVKLEPKNILVEVGKKDHVMRQELERYFRFRYPIILHYTNAMRQGGVGYSNYGLVLWFGEGKCNRYKDVISSSLTNTKKDFTHPSPKELKHYKKLVQMFSNEGDTVLDPFVGSGTTAIACKHLKRNYVGVDIDSNYCKIAEKRLAQEVLF